MQIFFTVIIFSFLTFIITSAYYRYSIRRFYVYVGDVSVSDIAENFDPRKKIINRKNEEEYKNNLRNRILNLLNSRKQSRKKLN